MDCWVSQLSFGENPEISDLDFVGVRSFVGFGASAEGAFLRSGHLDAAYSAPRKTKYYRGLNNCQYYFGGSIL